MDRSFIHSFIHSFPLWTPFHRESHVLDGRGDSRAGSTSRAHSGQRGVVISWSGKKMSSSRPWSVGPDGPRRLEIGRELFASSSRGSRQPKQVKAQQLAAALVSPRAHTPARKPTRVRRGMLSILGSALTRSDVRYTWTYASAQFPPRVVVDTGAESYAIRADLLPMITSATIPDMQLEDSSSDTSSDSGSEGPPPLID